MFATIEVALIAQMVEIRMKLIRMSTPARTGNGLEGLPFMFGARDMGWDRQERPSSGIGRLFGRRRARSDSRQPGDQVAQGEAGERLTDG